MRKTFAVAAALVLGLASSSYAAASYASGVIRINDGTANPNPDSANLNNVIGPADNTFNVITLGSTANGTFILHAGFIADLSSDTQIRLYLGSESNTGMGLAVDTIELVSNNALYGDAAFTATANPNQGMTFATTSGDFFTNIINGTYTAGSSFDFSQVTGIHFTFSITGGTTNDTFEVDAISNPEPGTIALFAIGLAGLGAAVRTRRKSAKARAARA